MVFKLEKEQQPFKLVGEQLYLLCNRYLRVLDLETGRESALHLLDRSNATSAATSAAGSSAASAALFGRASQWIAYNVVESVLMIVSEADGGSYEIHKISHDGAGAGTGAGEWDVCKGSGVAVFVACNWIVVLAKGQSKLVIKNVQNEVTKKKGCGPYSQGIKGCALLRGQESASEH